MKTNPTQPERQYARVARVFRKTILSATNARIRILGTSKVQK